MLAGVDMTESGAQYRDRMTSLVDTRSVGFAVYTPCEPTHDDDSTAGQRSRETVGLSDAIGRWFTGANNSHRRPTIPSRYARAPTPGKEYERKCSALSEERWIRRIGVPPDVHAFSTTDFQFPLRLSARLRTVDFVRYSMRDSELTMARRGAR